MSRNYFDELYEVRNDPKLPKWVGELYLEYHRVYTSMARNKRSNRKSELGLQNLEFSQCGRRDLVFPIQRSI